MSLIGGVVMPKGGDPGAALAAIEERLARFPHDRGRRWIGASAALAVLQLEITPEDRVESQPELPASGLSVAFDGRIDARAELSDRLGLEDRGAAPVADSRLFAAAFARWGEEAGRHVVGDYACAVFDRRTRTLTLFTDSMGNRPLFWAPLPRGGVAFASRIDALTRLEGVSPEIDERWVADFLTLTHLDPERTGYRGIRQLPQAHVLRVTAEGVGTPRRYWRLRDEPGPPAYATADEYYDHFRDVLERAVDDRMRGHGDLPVASMLSGGLDSSAVTAAAARSGGAPEIVAVSSRLPEGGAGAEEGEDEGRFIDAMLARYPEIRGIPVYAEEADFLSEMDRALEIFGQPTRDGFYYRTFALMEAASREGARLLFTGMGGDFFASAKLNHAVPEILRGLPAGALWAYARTEAAAGGSTSAKVIAGQLLRPPLAGAIERTGLLGARRVDRYLERLGVRPARAFAARVGLRDRVERSLAPEGGWRRRESLRDREDRLCRCGTFTQASSLNAAAGAAFGLQVTNPLLDRRVVAAACGTPLSVRRPAGNPRALLRESARPLLPGPIYRRTCKGAFCPDHARRATRALERLAAAGGESVSRYVEPDDIRTADDGVRTIVGRLLPLLLERWEMGVRR